MLVTDTGLVRSAGRRHSERRARCAEVGGAMLIARACYVTFALAMLVPGPAWAQDGLSGIVPKLIFEGITTAGGTAPGNPHAGHFTLWNPTAAADGGSSQAGSLVNQE